MGGPLRDLPQHRLRRQSRRIHHIGEGEPPPPIPPRFSSWRRQSRRWKEHLQHARPRWGCHRMSHASSPGPSTTSATWVPPRATAWTRPRPRSTVRRRSEEHTSELQSLAYLVCRLLLEKKKT